MNRWSTYTENELRNFTNNEMKELCELELTFTPNDSELKETIEEIREGKYRNPYRQNRFDIRFSLVISLYVLFVFSSEYIPTIPFLSDIILIPKEYRHSSKDIEYRIISHRDFNETNPRYCRNPGPEKKVCFESDYDY